MLLPTSYWCGCGDSAAFAHTPDDNIIWNVTWQYQTGYIVAAYWSNYRTGIICALPAVGLWSRQSTTDRQILLSRCILSIIEKIVMYFGRIVWLQSFFLYVNGCLFHDRRMTVGRPSYFCPDVVAGKLQGRRRCNNQPGSSLCNSSSSPPTTFTAAASFFRSFIHATSPYKQQRSFHGQFFQCDNNSRCYCSSWHHHPWYHQSSSHGLSVFLSLR